VTSALVPPIDRRAVLIFVALVALLLAPWPRWGRAFGAVFSAYGNVLVAVAGLGPPAPRFTVPPPGAVAAAEGGAWAVILTAGNRAMPLDTRIIGYTPLAVFVALALATPIERRRKLVVFAGGGAVLLARLAFATLVPLSGALAAGASSSLSALAWTVLIEEPVMSYAAPLAVWWVALALTTPRPRQEPARGARRGGRRRRHA
jgi:hypothetical protein